METFYENLSIISGTKIIYATDELVLKFFLRFFGGIFPLPRSIHKLPIDAVWVPYLFAFHSPTYLCSFPRSYSLLLKITAKTPVLLNVSFFLRKTNPPESYTIAAFQKDILYRLYRLTANLSWEETKIGDSEAETSFGIFDLVMF